MLTVELREKLAKAFHSWSGILPEKIIPLPSSGSDRSYFRISGGNMACVGALHTNKPEFKAFVYLTDHFRNKGLRVPELYFHNEHDGIYLLQDLGNTSLFDLTADPESAKDILPLYQNVLKELIRFQLNGHEGLNYDICYPRASFDQQSIYWDLNYFKYNYLKLAEIDFHEEPLEKDFQKLINRLLNTEGNYFMYRDFQARNVMIHEGAPWFIDYQGGRMGPLQYDVASLLFQVRANLPFDVREQLLDYYIGETEKNLSLNKNDFTARYYDYVLLRLMQVLGAYGYRGLFQKKPHFLQSLSMVGNNIIYLRDNTKVFNDLPEIYSSLMEAVDHATTFEIKGSDQAGALNISVSSFSYKKGIPQDYSGNGGGFVFDCRSLPNPGREEKYRSFTGQDQVIIDYLKQFEEVDNFFDHIKGIVQQAVSNYRQRGFTNLMVNFGCTGGQHRSVFFAERLTKELKMINGVNVNLKHVELEKNE